MSNFEYMTLKVKFLQNLAKHFSDYFFYILSSFYDESQSNSLISTSTCKTGLTEIFQNITS